MPHTFSQHPRSISGFGASRSPILPQHASQNVSFPPLPQSKRPKQFESHQRISQKSHLKSIEQELQKLQHPESVSGIPLPAPPGLLQRQHKHCFTLDVHLHNLQHELASGTGPPTPAYLIASPNKQQQKHAAQLIL